MDDPSERLRWARHRAGFRSGRAAALACEWPESTYAAHENGSRRIGEDDARKYARRFKVHWLWILFGDVAPAPARTVLASAEVGPGGVVSPLAEAPEDGEELPLPPGLSSDTVAITVRGDAMAPVYDDGDILFYDRPASGQAVAQLAGLRCVVKLANGPLLLRKLTIGRGATRFTLWAHNAAPQHDQRLEWAATVAWVRPARMVGR